MDSDLESSGNEYFPSDTSGSSEEEDTITFSDADLLLGPGDDDRDAESFCGDVDNGMDFLHKDDGDDDMDVELLRNDDGLSDIFCGDDDGEDNEDNVSHTHHERIVESSDSDDSVVYPALKKKQASELSVKITDFS